MGLDSSIEMTIDPKELPLTIIPNFVYDEKPTPIVEVVYFRKCWNIRNEVMEAIHGESCCDTPLTADNLRTIFDIIQKYRSKDYFDEVIDCFWSFDELQDQLDRALHNIAYLIPFVRDNPDIKVVWTDSF